jgi:hypothetical protein
MKQGRSPEYFFILAEIATLKHTSLFGDLSAMEKFFTQISLNLNSNSPQECAKITNNLP